MNTSKTDRKNFVSELNLTFALLVIIKLLMSFVLPYWSVPVGRLLELIGVVDIKAAFEDLSTTADVAGLCICISLYTFCVSVPVALAFALKKGHSSADHAYYTRAPSFLQTLCAVGTTFTVSYTVTAALFLCFDYISGMLGYNFTPPSPETPDSIMLMPLFIFYLCVLPALSEEFLTRGLAASVLKKCGKGFAVLMTGVIFMMMHTSVFNYAFSLCTGLCIGYFALRFDSIWIGVTVHFCINLNSAVFQFLEKNLDTVEGQRIHTLYFFAVALFSVAFFLSFLFVYRPKKPDQPVKSPEFPGRIILKSPFFYIFIAVFLITSLNDIMSILK